MIQFWNKLKVSFEQLSPILSTFQISQIRSNGGGALKYYFPKFKIVYIILGVGVSREFWTSFTFWEISLEVNRYIKHALFSGATAVLVYCRCPLLKLKKSIFLQPSFWIKFCPFRCKYAILYACLNLIRWGGNFTNVSIVPSVVIPIWEIFPNFHAFFSNVSQKGWFKKKVYGIFH